jgi:hypothetical protein
MESKVPLKSIRKDPRTPKKPVKCHVPNSLFKVCPLEALSHPMVHFIGAEVGVALNYYYYAMHELWKVNKVNEVKLF